MKVLVAETSEDLNELVNQFSDDYEVYVSEEIQIEGDPTSFEEAMRSHVNDLGEASLVL